MTARFAFGADLVSAVAGEPATLSDHVWLWTEQGPVAVAVEGREVHGVLLDDRVDDVVALAPVVVRTARGESRRALAVVVADAEPAPPDLAELDLIIAAARRLGLPTSWIAQLEIWRRATPIDERRRDGPTSLRELLAVPGIDEQLELRSRFGFLAIHGGDLEINTDLIASSAASAAAASYYAVVHPDGYTAHLASTSFDPAQSEALARFLDHVDVVVSIHGYGRQGQWRSLLLGGTNRALADHLAAAVGPLIPEYELVTDLAAIPPELRGMHRRNPVNRPTGGGVQLELPPRVRGLSPLSPPPGPDGLSPPTRALIDGLAAAARSWLFD